MGVVAKVYTVDNICEGIPDGRWCYRLLLMDDEVRLVEAYSGNGWCDVDSDIVDQDQFNRIQKDEPDFYGEQNYSDYVAFVFLDMFKEEDGSYGITDTEPEIRKESQFLSMEGWNSFYKEWLKRQYEE